MFLLALFACAHSTVVWEATPPAAVTRAFESVTVVAADERCASVAQRMAVAIAALPNAVVIPGASTRLLVNLCKFDVRTELEVEQAMFSLGSNSSAPDHSVRAAGSAVVTVEIDGKPGAMLKGQSTRVRAVHENDREILQHRVRAHDAVVDAVALDLVDRLWPRPETFRRRWYRNPEQGTWQSVHNQAVNLERAGRCLDSLALMEESVRKSPNPSSSLYLASLRQRCSPH